MRLRVPSLPLLSGLTIRHAVSCGVGCRRSSDPALLWLWRRPVATAPIEPLAWEPPYAAGAAQEIGKKTKKKKKKSRSATRQSFLLPLSNRPLMGLGILLHCCPGLDPDMLVQSLAIVCSCLILEAMTVMCGSASLRSVGQVLSQEWD